MILFCSNLFAHNILHLISSGVTHNFFKINTLLQCVFNIEIVRLSFILDFLNALIICATKLSHTVFSCSIMMIRTFNLYFDLYFKGYVIFELFVHLFQSVSVYTYIYLPLIHNFTSISQDINLKGSFTLGRIYVAPNTILKTSFKHFLNEIHKPKCEISKLYAYINKSLYNNHMYNVIVLTVFTFNFFAIFINLVILISEVKCYIFPLSYKTKYKLLSFVFAEKSISINASVSANQCTPRDLTNKCIMDKQCILKFNFNVFFKNVTRSQKCSNSYFIKLIVSITITVHLCIIFCSYRFYLFKITMEIIILSTKSFEKTITYVSNYPNFASLCSLYCIQSTDFLQCHMSLYISCILSMNSSHFPMTNANLNYFYYNMLPLIVSSEIFISHNFLYFHVGNLIHCICFIYSFARTSFQFKQIMQSVNVQCRTQLTSLSIATIIIMRKLQYLSHFIELKLQYIQSKTVHKFKVHNYSSSLINIYFFVDKFHGNFFFLVMD